MLPTAGNACIAAGILKHTRGKRDGSYNRLTNSIQVLDSRRRRRQINIPVMKRTRNQVSANHWNLLNIQIDTLLSSSRQALSTANTSSMHWEAAFCSIYSSLQCNVFGSGQRSLKSFTLSTAPTPIFCSSEKHG